MPFTTAADRFKANCQCNALLMPKQSLSRRAFYSGQVAATHCAKAILLPLAGQLAHGGVKALERQREHAIVHRFLDDFGRL